MASFPESEELRTCLTLQPKHTLLRALGRPQWLRKQELLRRTPTPTPTHVRRYKRRTELQTGPVPAQNIIKIILFQLINTWFRNTEITEESNKLRNAMPVNRHSHLWFGHLEPEEAALSLSQFSTETAKFGSWKPPLSLLLVGSRREGVNNEHHVGTAAQSRPLWVRVRGQCKGDPRPLCLLRHHTNTRLCLLSFRIFPSRCLAVAIPFLGRLPLVAWLLTGGGLGACLLDGCSGGDIEGSQYW